MLLYSQVILSSRRIIFIMTKKNAPTMKDVAREAGVALGTVSKVINGIPVSEEYRNRVLAAIETLHYEVNTYARGLKTQRTNLIALIIPNTVNPFFSAFTAKCVYPFTEPLSGIFFISQSISRPFPASPIDPVPIPPSGKDISSV